MSDDVWQLFAAQPQHVRRANIESWLLTHQPLLRDIAHRIAFRGQNPTDEPLSAVMVSAARILTGTDEELSTYRSIGGVVTKTATQELQLQRRSSLPSGSKGADRLAAEVEKTRQMLLRELGFPPTQEELIARHNERMSATRVNPVKQGMLIDRTRLAQMEQIAGRREVELPEQRTELTTPSHESLVVLQAVIAVTIRRCEQMSPVLGRVAQLRLDVEASGETVPPKQIAEQLCLEVEAAELMVLQVLQVLVDELDAEADTALEKSVDAAQDDPDIDPYWQSEDPGFEFEP